MRVLLVALNAKYVHTNLALRYLRAGIKQRFPDVTLREYSINEALRRITAEIYEAKADIVGFSCYIWNIAEVTAVIDSLRLVCPGTRFVLGGPEASFEATDVLKTTQADAIVVGEGEETFVELLSVWERGEDPEHIQGIVWRRGEQVIENPPRRMLQELNNLPFPYGEEEKFDKRLVYVETTRGCPFYCQYCLSSSEQGVRYIAPEKFRQTLRRLLQLGARTIKFVDRTFNASKEHAFRILDIVREETSKQPRENIRVHCEMAGELLDEDWQRYLLAYPEGLVQLEIGVQSTYTPTLKAIRRNQDFHRWQEIVRILRKHRIPIHMDLIAGLPLEGWLEFQQSFNDVYSVQPQRLQLGFLKLLKGCGLRRVSTAYGLKYSSLPPYTILATQVLRYEDIIWLERVEELLERYYNSGKFPYTLQASIELFESPFAFFHQLAEFWQTRGWYGQSWQGKLLLENLWEFIRGYTQSPEQQSLIRDAMRFDYFFWERPGSLPGFLQETYSSPEAEKNTRLAEEQVRNREQWVGIVPQAVGMDRRHWARVTAAVYFQEDVLRRISRPETELEEMDPSGLESSGVWYLFFYDSDGVKFYRK